MMGWPPPPPTGPPPIGWPTPPWPGRCGRPHRRRPGRRRPGPVPEKSTNSSHEKAPFLEGKNSLATINLNFLRRYCSVSFRRELGIGTENIRDFIVDIGEERSYHILNKWGFVFHKDPYPTTLEFLPASKNLFPRVQNGHYAVFCSLPSGIEGFRML